jgi:hypothetical protein
MRELDAHLWAYILQYFQDWIFPKRRFDIYCTICKSWRDGLHLICKANYKIFKDVYLKVILKSSERLSCTYWFEDYFFKPRRQLYFTLKGIENQEDIVKYLKKYFFKVQAHEVKSVKTFQYYQIICWLPRPIPFYHIRN